MAILNRAEAAVAYARNGWRVLPLHCPTSAGCSCGKPRQDPPLCKIGKHPRIASWQTSASCDVGQVEAWWTEWPDANIGLTLAHLLVLDVDLRHGGLESLADLESEYVALDLMSMQRTGSGGFHYLFAPEGVTKTVQGFRPGLDLLTGEGHYICVAPSVHESGGVYTWVDEVNPLSVPHDSILLPSAPRWLLDASKSKSADKKSAGPIPDVIEQGDRHNTLLSIAGSMHKRGISSEAVIAALVVVNKNQCKPPYNHAHLVKIAKSVEKYEVDNASVGRGDDFVLELGTAAELMKKHLVPVKWAVASLLPVAGVSILAGRPKQGKSWMALQLCIAVANGTDALGRFATTEGRVLYFGLEDGPSRLQTRLGQLLCNEAALANLDLSYDLPALIPKGLGVLDACLTGASQPYKLIVLDTYVAVLGSGQKDRDPFRGDYAEIKMLRGLARKHTVSILVVHHTRKPTKGENAEPQDSIMGTTGVTAGADSNLVIVQRKDVLALVVSGKDFPEAVNEFAMTLNIENGSGWTIQGTAAAAAITSQRSGIVALLKDQGPLEPKEIAERLGKNRSTIRTTLEGMLTAGLLVKSGKTYEAAGYERQADLTEKEF